MFEENALTGAGQYNPQAGTPVRMPTIKERCNLAVKEARELLDRNPDLERLLDIMQQSHF